MSAVAFYGPADGNADVAVPYRKFATLTCNKTCGVFLISIDFALHVEILDYATELHVAEGAAYSASAV